MREHISYDCKSQSNSTICNSNQKWNNKTCQYEKGYSWNSSTCICENSKYLKSAANTAVTKCDKIVIAMLL